MRIFRVIMAAAVLLSCLPAAAQAQYLTKRQCYDKAFKKMQDTSVTLPGELTAFMLTLEMDVRSNPSYDLEAPAPKSCASLGRIAPNQTSANLCKSQMACQDEGYAKYNSGDLLGSAKAWDRSCDMGLMDSCALAGESYNLSKDTKTAYSRFKKGCENGSLLACYGYGALIAKPFYMESRVDYKIDMEEGLSYLQKACQGGIDDACTRWTKAYGHGGGIDVSAEAVYAMRGEACRISQKASDCGQYYQLVYDGEGGPQDKARAVPELRKACRGGNQLACKFLDRNNHSR